MCSSDLTAMLLYRFMSVVPLRYSVSVIGELLEGVQLLWRDEAPSNASCDPTWCSAAKSGDLGSALAFSASEHGTCAYESFATSGTKK